MDLKETVFLPRTAFAMRARLPEREPLFLEKWQDIYHKLMKKREGASDFILHDGPPYANGHAHIGHALNRILKDFVLRSQSMFGKRTPFVPGWDCHGLPIEWKIEEEYRKKGVSKDDVDPQEFRHRCRQFAAEWVDVQREDLKRLGLMGDWAHPYVTMDFETEADILECLGRFLINGGLVKGFKPVHWSVVEKTALAEAEIEYKDKVSPSIYVSFPIVETSDPQFVGASCVIWTTTPWTIPANRAIAYGEDVDYVLLQAKTGSAHVSAGQKLIVAQALLDELMQVWGLTSYQVLAHINGSHLKGMICHHPLKSMGYHFDVPLLPGNHVTIDAGTGLVHTAPSHGLEDFLLGQEYGLEVPETITDDGFYTATIPGFEGVHIFKANDPVIEALKDAGALLHRQEVTHSYPHSWRSKAPLILRATPQWFISMEKNELSQKALAAIEQVKWYPASGEKRIHSMIADRPDWCISRQRMWGVPLGLFVHKKTGELLRDQNVLQRVVSAVRESGSDVWFDGDPTRFLAPDYDAQDYTAMPDILDVWFESGVSHQYVLGRRKELKAPADLYLEGSDQHRGWFQSSLLTSCGMRGEAPFKQVLTHGFILDQNGRKMSKSTGNTVLPEEVIESSGAEMLRLWVASSDFKDDVKIGKAMMRHQQDTYRRLRNTFRYLLGSIADYRTADERVSYDELPALEKWVLHRLWELDQVVRQNFASYNFAKVFAEVHHFCAVDLSAFYFDIRKDAVYCDGMSSLRRRSARYVFNLLLEHLTLWLAPLLCFTTEEVWLAYKGEDAESVHLQVFPEIPNQWKNEEVHREVTWQRQYRRVITGALEAFRSAGNIRSSLEAEVTLYDPEGLIDENVDWAALSIVSQVKRVPSLPPEGTYALPDVKGIGVAVSAAQGEKCERCWQILPEVQAADIGKLCRRCHDVVSSGDYHKIVA